MARPGTVVTPGNHDGVHVGHRALVAESVALARPRGLRVVALTFHPHPVSVLAPEKAPALLTMPARRAALLRGAGADDAVVQPFDRSFAALTPEAFVRQVLCEGLGCAVIVCGADFRFGAQRAGDVEALAAFGRDLGFEVRVVPPVQLDGVVVSSSRVRESLGRGAVHEAAALLARFPDLDGEVIHGDHRGRTLGVPTANLACDPVMLPANGVYAVLVRRLDAPGALLHGVANLGVRPTFGAGPSVEVHVLDFDGDLYGTRLRVGFVERLRGEQKFDGLDALKAQIARDIDAARGVLPRALGSEQARWI